MVKYLIEKGADIHADEDYALRSASKKGNLRIVKYLIKNGADINAKDDDALKNAVRNGNTKTSNYLIQSGANPNVVLRKGYYDDLIAYARENGYEEVIDYLESLN